MHILHMHKERVLASGVSFSTATIRHNAYCLVPHDRAQLLTYHHGHPSRPPCVLLQLAPGNSAHSPRFWKGIVPVSPTGILEEVAAPVWWTLE